MDSTNGKLVVWVGGLGVTIPFIRGSLRNPNHQQKPLAEESRHLAFGRGCLALETCFRQEGFCMIRLRYCNQTIVLYLEIPLNY